MATEDELHALCERIVQLSGRDQTRLLELVLAEARAARAREDELGRQQLKAMEERCRQRQRTENHK